MANASAEQSFDELVHHYRDGTLQHLAYASAEQGFDELLRQYRDGILQHMANASREQSFDELLRRHRAYSSTLANASADQNFDELVHHYREHPGVAPSWPHANVRPRVLIVTGPPASGKSTLGRQLAQRLGFPYLSKDLFKETLYDELGWSDTAWSQRLGGASVALLYRSAAALLEAGQSVALESNFYAEWDTPPLRALIDRFQCRCVQVVCTASGATLVQRYTQRIANGERHRGHTESDDLHDILMRLQTERWDALDLPGAVITVDTEQDLVIDMDALTNQVRAAFGRSSSVA